VNYTENPHLVRGLDYYRHTAFEFVTDRLGAQGTVLGGGRYDGLIETLGGPHTPAVGWAAGIERLAMLVGERNPPRLNVAIVSEARSTDALAWKLGFCLRRKGLSTDIWAEGAPGKRFAKAIKEKPLLVLVLDDKAVNERTIAVMRVRSLTSGNQVDEDLAGRIIDGLDTLNLWAGVQPIIEHGRELELKSDIVV
jgi:histidyl-tRNA synthetase